MKEQQFRKALQEIAEQNISDELDLWPSLQIRLHDSSDPRRVFTPSIARVGFLILVGVLLFLFAAVTYAIGPTIRNLLRLDLGLAQVDSIGLGHSLDLDQTVEGVTVALNWAYADENRIAVAYTIEASGGQQYEPTQFTLVDDTGRTFPSTVGMGADLDGLPPGVGEYVFSFDAASITGSPTTLDLSLDLWLKTLDSPSDVGPFFFEFDLPFTPGRVTEPKQSVTANGITITLEKVKLTPSGLSAVICFEGPNKEYEWLPISHIDVNTGETNMRATVGRQINPNDIDCTTNDYFPSLYNYTGSWTLTVTELVGLKKGYTEQGQPEIDQLRIRNKWLFDFQMP